MFYCMFRFTCDRSFNAAGSSVSLGESQRLITLSSSAIFADMTTNAVDCGDAAPFNIVGEEKMKTGFVSR